MLHEMRSAARFLVHHPGFTVTAVLTVALAIGATVAIFSVVDSVLFKPLPYRDADRLYVLRVNDLKTGTRPAALMRTDVEAAWATGLFEQSATADPIARRLFLVREEQLTPVFLQAAPRGFTDLLGIRPVYGRVFDRSDEGSSAVLLSFRSWHRYFGGNLAVLDSMLRVADGPSLHVVGILPPSFRSPLFEGPVFDGIVLRPHDEASDWSPIVKLKSGVTEAATTARLRSIQGADLKPGSTELALVPIRQDVGSQVTTSFWMLLWAAAVVYLLGCGNLVNLVLARGTTRLRELAVRTALGASRGRILRLLWTEALLLGLAGGLLGILLASWTFSAIVSALPATLARAASPALDVRGILFGLAMSMLASLLFGVLPAFRLLTLSRTERCSLSLRSPTRPSGRKLLLAAQLAGCTTMVIVSALLGRSLIRLISQDLGFATDRMVVNFTFPKTIADRSDIQAVLQRTLVDIRMVPGVKAAGMISTVPFGGERADDLLFEGTGQDRGGVWSVSAGCLRALGIELLQGRDLTAAESSTNAPVAILNESAARRLFPAGSALGRTVRAPHQPARAVVGIVRDWRQSLRRPAIPAMYVPFDPSRFHSARIVLDSSIQPAALKPLIARLVPNAYVAVATVDALLDAELETIRFSVKIVGTFTALAVTLATIGVYGLVAFLAAERTREYGIRLALGATARHMRGAVQAQFAIPLITGIVAGAVAAYWLALVRAQLFEVAPGDPVSVAGAVATVAVAGFAAMQIPALRAARLDPVVTLRSE